MAEPLSLDTEQQSPQAKPQIPRETHVQYKAENAHWAVAQMSNGKAGPCIRSWDLADQGRYGGAVAELWKAVVGQHAHSLLACAQSITDAWTETAATVRVPREDKDAEIAFLLIQAKALEMQKKLENHCAAQSLWQGLVKSIRSYIGAGSGKGCKPMSIWFTP